MKYLKQSTAVVIPFGPALLPADGVTLVTSLVSALDHASTGIFLCKNGGAAAIRHATVTATTYDAYGSYLVTLDTTDTATLGRLRVMFAAAASTLPIWEDFTVLSANIYDSLVAGTDLFDVSVTQLLGTAWLAPGVAGTPDVNAKLIGATAQTGRDLGAAVESSPLESGTAQTGASSSITLRSGASSTSSLYKNQVIEIYGGTGAGQSRIIAVYVGSTRVATVDENWVTTPDNTSTYRIKQRAPSLTSGAITTTLTLNNAPLDSTGVTTLLTSVGTAGAGLTALGDTRIANLDATISSRTKPADTQAAVTLVTTTTTLTNKTGFALTAGEHTNIVGDVDTALDAATTELSTVPGSTASLRKIIQFIGQYFRFKRNTTATTETMYQSDSSTSLGTSTVSDDGTTATHGKIA